MLFALVLTTVALVVLILHMPSVTAAARTARTADDTAVVHVGGDTLDPALGLLVLVLVAVLNLYKPRGTTRYGQRRRAKNAAGATQS